MHKKTCRLRQAILNPSSGHGDRRFHRRILGAFHQSFGNIQIDADQTVKQLFSRFGKPFGGLLVDEDAKAHQISFQLIRQRVVFFGDVSLND